MQILCKQIDENLATTFGIITTCKILHLNADGHDLALKKTLLFFIDAESLGLVRLRNFW